MLRAATFVFVSATVFAAGPNDLPFKQVSAPATDIVSGRVRMPSTDECATRSRAQLIPAEFTWSADGVWTFDAIVPVAGSGHASIGLLAPGSAGWNLDVRAKSDSLMPIEQVFGVGQVERRTQVLGDDMPGWSVDRFDVEHVQAGSYALRITVPSSNVARPSQPNRDAQFQRPAPGWLVVRDAAPIAMSAGTATLATLSENEIGIVAHVYDADRNEPTQVLANFARSGHVDLETTSGTQRLELFDDGLHQDGAANDGVFGAILPRWTSGDVRARVELDGITHEGDAFQRSVQLQFPVIERRTALSGNVASYVEDDLRLRIDLGALPLGPQSQLHASAEVWGTNDQGELVPVCWLSRMLVPQLRGGEWQLPLFLDGRWLDVAHVTAPLALHNVRVQDPDTEIPYDEVDWLPLPTSALPPVVGHGPRRIVPSMLMSAVLTPRAQPTQVQNDAPSLIQPTLLLVHGYCSSGSIWPAADFSQPKQEFLDPNQNRTHDQFAQLLQHAVVGRRSFGVVTHSQGGMAALHLYTYYVSGLDDARGPRRIQTLAAPYQGTPLASLGGFTCGVNNDMTPAGSTMWLAGIPTWARNEVYYWTTSDAGSACNFLTGLLLTNPEDGTVEMFRAQLPGGHSMGHVTGWCHTTGMTYPAGYTDHVRNADLNTNAAR